MLNEAMEVVLNSTSPGVGMRLFSCNVTRNHVDPQLFLIIKEHSSVDEWYHPGGKVDRGETFEEGAKREALEEGGIPISCQGVLRIEHNASWHELRVLWASSSVDNTPPKSKPDAESDGARWIQLEDMKKYPPRDRDFVPAYWAAKQGAPVYSQARLLVEKQKKCFSTRNCQDPFHMMACVVVCKKTENECSFLVTTTVQKSSTKVTVPHMELAANASFLSAAGTILNNIGKQTGCTIMLHGILNVEHVPLTNADDSGWLGINYMATVKDEHTSAQKDCGDKFAWLSWEQFKQLKLNCTARVEEFLNNNGNIFPLSLVVDSIYSPWQSLPPRRYYSITQSSLSQLMKSRHDKFCVLLMVPPLSKLAYTVVVCRDDRSSWQIASELSVDMSEAIGLIDGRLALCGMGLTEIPFAALSHIDLASVTELDLSFNSFRWCSKVSGIEKFPRLVALILDNNAIEKPIFPSIPTLNTLWVNTNKISDINAFIECIEKNMPNLTYLSMLKNPACPNYFTGKDGEDYQKYRIYVLYRLKKLKFLDASPVTPQERKEAARVGQFMQIARPEPTQQTEPEYQVQKEDPLADIKPLPSDVQQEGIYSASFGYSRYIYHGKQSEGNRFIVNEDL